MLTKREREILGAIVDYIDRHEIIPSVRELTKAVGLSSSSTTHAHLVNLEKKGFIEREKEKTRGIRVLQRDMDAGHFYCKECAACEKRNQMPQVQTPAL